MKNSSSSDSHDLVEMFAEQLRKAGFEGDVELEVSSRLVMATDNSIYQQLPAGVLFPRTTSDVQRIMRVANRPKYRSLTFSPRGGGTGTNGQSLSSGLLIDVSRYMNDILELDIAARRVRVQAGVVKDALNDYLRPHGLFFSPDLSTSNRAVIGGMISTDASGQGSLRYGKTSDHVQGLRCVLSDGEVLDTRSLPLEVAATEAANEGIAARAMEQLLETHAHFGEEIAQRFPELNRFLTGYDLKHALTGDQLDLGRLICGAEGTLAIVTETWLDLDVIPERRTLVNINYDSFDSALRSAGLLLEADALSVETVDSTVLKLARADVLWTEVSDDIDDSDNPAILGLNLVEFADSDRAVHGDKVASFCQMLDRLKGDADSGVLGYKVCTELDSLQRVYQMRKKSVGLLANLEGSAQPVAFVEDTCVPPEKLADFIAEFRALLDANGLQYGMFGHVDTGVLHVRPALDLTCSPDRQLVRTLSDAVSELVAQYGGILWGEHGRGFRSEYGPVYFGDVLYAELRKLKAAFDPHNRLNPGKICTPWKDDGQSSPLVSIDGPFRGEFDEQIIPTLREDYAGPLSCNGNGLCFNYRSDSAMCPSFKATGDRRHSPKGRASLIREWLRQQSVGEVNDVFEAEVAEALRGCLACKACSSACPVKVDIPHYRSQFLEHYHRRHRRPVKDYLVAGVEHYTPLLAKWPRLANALTLNPVSQKVMPLTTGMTDLPALSPRSVLSDVRTLHSVEELGTVSVAERAHTVCLIADAFSLYYEAEFVRALARLVQSLGKTALLVPFVRNGKPMHVKGFLPQFEKLALRSSQQLQQLSELGVELVGTDPAMTLCYRDEYRQTLGERRGDFDVMLPQEWLLRQSPPTVKKPEADKYLLLAHCTERSLLADTNDQWRRVFERFGLGLNTPAAGCCGMCGSYGHESDFVGTSKAIFDLDWGEKLATTDQEVLATGYSCRSQVRRIRGQRIRHPIEVLLDVIETDSPRPPHQT